jgi:hypothetical protein
MSICKSIDCFRPSQAKGYCDKHYRRFIKYGDPEIVHIFKPKKCLDKVCDRNSKSKGYCDKHYRRFIKTGTSELQKIVRSCSVDGCIRRHMAKDLCSLHYEMSRNNVVIDDSAAKIIEQHNGLCDICSSSSPGFGRKRLCIDHDHATGVVRGMLCQKCNIVIGNFNDDIDLLQRAIKYLKK